jgi:all-trans-retinol 13,14-reductase
LVWNPNPDIYDEIRIAGRTYAFRAGMDRFRAGLLAAFSAEGQAINRYFAAAFSSVKAGNLYFAEKAIPPVLSRLTGSLMRSPV